MATVCDLWIIRIRIRLKGKLHPIQSEPEKFLISGRIGVQNPDPVHYWSVPASRAWRSAHIWEKQICLKVQQRQSNAKWFQSLLLPPSGSFNSKKF